MAAEAKIKISASAEGVKEAAEYATKALTIGFAAITAVVTKGVIAFKENEDAINQLNVAMANSGIYSKELSQQYQDQATALSQLSTFGDEEIVNAQARLQTYIGNTKVSKELTQATLDLATAKGIDLEKAAQLVGKTIQGETNALKGVGVELDTTGTKSEKLAKTIDGLNSKFGGSAAAATDGLGAMKVLGNAVGEVFEVIGRTVAPYVILVSKALTGLANNTSNAKTFSDTLTKAFHTVASVANYVIVIFEMVGGTIGVVLGTAVEAATALMSANFSKAKDIAKLGMSEIGRVMDEADERGFARQKAVDDAELASQNAKLLKEEQLLRQSSMRKGEIKNAEAESDQARANALAIKAQDQALLDVEAETASQLEKDARRMAAIDNQLKNETDLQTRTQLIQERGVLVEKQASDKKIALAKAERDAKLAIMSTAFGNLSSLMQTGSRKLFEIGKAAAIAGAIINTSQAAIAALAPPPLGVGPLLGPILAGTAIVAGAVQIANIRSQSMAHGGLVEGGIPGKDSVPIMAMPGELVAPRSNFDEVVNAVANQRAAQRSGDGGGAGGPGSKTIAFKFDTIIGTESFVKEQLIPAIRDAVQFDNANLGV